MSYLFALPIVAGLALAVAAPAAGESAPPAGSATRPNSFPHGKCNLYGFGTGVPLAIAGPGGRVVDDMVSLTDLAPTFLEAGGQPIPASMTGRSLWPVLRATASGQVDPARDAVFTGRERHVAEARADFTAYPQRAIRTASAEGVVSGQSDGDRWWAGLSIAGLPTGGKSTKSHQSRDSRLRGYTSSGASQRKVTIS